MAKPEAQAPGTHTKKSKPDANYRKHTDWKTCGGCKSMNDDGTCKKVEGIVKPNMVCDLFTPR